MASFEFYQQRAEQFQSQAEQIEKIIRQYAWARIALMIVALALIYLGFSNTSFFYFVGPVILVFFFLVQKQVKKEEQKRIVENLITLNEAEANCTKFEYTEFPDGQRFADPHHSYGYDLDLFGKGSLYQYLNRSATQLGQEKLASDLSHPGFDKEGILQRQEAVQDLDQKLNSDSRHGPPAVRLMTKSLTVGHWSNG